jgi:biotin carboxyl carrier protein
MSKRKFKVTVNGKTFVVEVEEVSGPTTPTEAPPETETPRAREEGVPEPAERVTPPPRVVPQERVTAPPRSGEVRAPMPGVIVSTAVAEGDEVEQGEPLLVLEAMKMENEIQAPRDGVVAELRVSEGDRVDSGDTLVVIE